MPGAPSSFLFLVAMPFPPSSGMKLHKHRHRVAQDCPKESGLCVTHPKRSPELRLVPLGHLEGPDSRLGSWQKKEAPLLLSDNIILFASTCCHMRLVHSSCIVTLKKLLVTKGIATRNKKLLVCSGGRDSHFFPALPELAHATQLWSASKGFDSG